MNEEVTAEGGEVESLLGFLGGGEEPATPGAGHGIEEQEELTSPPDESSKPEPSEPPKTEGDAVGESERELTAEEKRVIAAGEAFRARAAREAEMAAQRQQAQEAQARREADLEERKQNQEWMRAAIESLQGDTKDSAEEPKPFTEDPEAWAKRIEEGFASRDAEIAALKQQLEEEAQMAEAQRVAQQQGIQAVEALRSDMQLWEQQAPGFVGEYQNGQLVRPGVYEAWQESAGNQLRAEGFPENTIAAKLYQKLQEFQALSQHSGMPWPYHLEQAAAAMRIWDEPQAQGAAPAATAEPAASSAQDALMVGSIAHGANPSAAVTGEMPQTVGELREAGIDPREWANYLRKSYGGNTAEMIEAIANAQMNL